MDVGAAKNPAVLGEFITHKAGSDLKNFLSFLKENENFRFFLSPSPCNENKDGKEQNLGHSLGTLPVLLKGCNIRAFGVKLKPMFTGIVRAVGKVVRLEPQRLWITRENLEVSLGASVAVNGVCLTVAALDGEKMAFDLSWETLARTNLGELGPGDPVNLEPALRPGAELGGHFVLGHVDTVGKITILARRGEDFLLEVSFDPRFAELLADKGSVAVDGISLTPFSVGEGTFRCAIVPYTWENTNLRFRRVGDRVNLEFDILAKYVRRWREK